MKNEGHAGGLHQSAITSNTDVSLYVYGASTSSTHLPIDVYVKIIYNINDPSIPSRYSFNTAKGYNFGTPIPFTLTEKGEYNFTYEYWKEIPFSADIQVTSPAGRPIYVWYD